MARIGKDGQVVIPRDVMERHGLHEGDEVDVVPSRRGSGRARVGDGEGVVRRVYGILRGRGLTKTTDEYIEEIRGR